MDTTDFIETLKKKYEDEVAKNAQLTKTIRTLTGADLSENDRSALVFLDSAGDHIASADDVARHLGVVLGKAEYILGRLVGSNHISVDIRTPPRYTIEQKGRMVVHGSAV